MGTAPVNRRGAVLLCSQALATNYFCIAGLVAVFYSREGFSKTWGREVLMLDYIRFCFRLLKLVISV